VELALQAQQTLAAAAVDRVSNNQTSQILPVATVVLVFFLSDM